jgi:hypothetical protein
MYMVHGAVTMVVIIGAHASVPWDAPLRAWRVTRPLIWLLGDGQDHAPPPRRVRYREPAAVVVVSRAGLVVDTESAASRAYKVKENI